MKKTKKPNFNDYLDVIDSEIAKKRFKWKLDSLSWMDYDDVAQIIRLHIYAKWDKYDPQRPIRPWLSRVIVNQIHNIIRNNYSNYARPCLRCDAAEDSDGCKIYKKQCEDCPLFADWKKKKQHAHNIKLPVSIENHANEISNIFDETSDISSQIEKIHSKMKEILKPIEYKVYEGLFILHEDEATVAKKIGYISNERGRAPGYKQIKNIRKLIILKIRRCIESQEIDLF